jgi:monofunctional glycosyltransferase
MFKQILLQGLRKARLILVIVSVYAVVCRWMMPPTTTTQLQSIIQGKSVSFRRDYVPIEQVSPYFLLAVIASEDAKFPQHHGIDIDATIYALRTGKGGGASTILLS